MVQNDNQPKSTKEYVKTYQTGNLSVRLVGTFGEKRTMDEMLYEIACQKVAVRLAKCPTSLFQNAAMV